MPLKKIPDIIISKYYGCGTPIPFGIEGLNVLDLGSGSGRDCYIAAQLVGPSGTVTGIDMTKEQLSVANSHIEGLQKRMNYEKPNLRFIEGYIEFLHEAGIEKNSLDLVISNCVVNLSPDKKRVLQGVYSVLNKGGEFYFSDVYCDRRLPENVRNHEVLLGECIAGALYIEDFKRICHQVGFIDPRILSVSPITVDDEELKLVVGSAKFYSITFRLFKVDNLETLCEDYGQYAVYKGTIKGHESTYILDDHHEFEMGKPILVCGNTASMLGETWLKPHFQITGSRAHHYGLFKSCSTQSTANQTSCCG